MTKKKSAKGETPDPATETPEDQTPDTTKDTQSEPDKSTDPVDAESIEPTSKVESDDPSDTETPEASDDGSLHVDQDPVTAEPALPLAQPEPPKQRSVFLPLVLGGVVAAMAGFVAARSQIIDPILPPAWRADGSNSNLADALDTLQADVSGIKSRLGDMQGQIDQIPAPTDLSGDIAQLGEGIDNLTTRIEDVEGRPAPAGTGVSSTALRNLTDQVAAQQAQIEKLLEDAQLAQQSSSAAANDTLARAAATRVLAAIDSGAPFATALDDLRAVSDVAIAPALAEVAATGVTPLSELQSGFPDAARAALAAARAADSSASGGVGDFLRRQLGARSVQPREGADPDAVLSRVEDDVRRGHMNDALAEVETLPEPARDALADWIAPAKARQAAMNEADALIQRLTAN